MANKWLMSPFSPHTQTALGAGSGCILAIVLISNMSAFCNDASLQLESGGARIIEGGDAHVRMDSEYVQIDFYSDMYTVDASFFLSNTGNDQNIVIGFPRHGFGYVGDFNGVIKDYKDFRMWLDGKEVLTRDVPGFLKLETLGDRGDVVATKKTSDPGEIESIRKRSAAGEIRVPSRLEEMRWNVVDIRVPAHNQIVSRVRYAISYEKGGSLNYFTASYLYGTGRSWLGNIGIAMFRVEVHEGIRLSDWPKFQEPSYKMERLGENAYLVVLTDFEPAEANEMGFMLSDKWEAFCFHTEFLYGDKPVPLDVLNLLSLSGLQRLRDYILAYAGKPGLDLGVPIADLDWYKPNPAFSENDLTPCQRANLEAIDKYREDLEHIVGRNQKACADDAK